MSENKTKEEILKEEYEKMVAECPGHNWGAWENEHDSVAIGIRAMTRFADHELKKPNEFIRDIAKLLGEDGLGFDGISWTVDDFKAAIDQEKRSTAIAFHTFMFQWVPYHDNTYIPRNEFAEDRYPKYIDELYDLFINSL